ncbi:MULTISPECIES: glycosyltransferase family 4 protein [Clostridium]|uniref:glycosyltransferase family 4 protein n=1 Tax=Clostridium TaxID=1485 RepID=UPI0005C21E4C|nr:MULTISPECIES: glycosyltransferase family 4 protein [Clostridium]KIU08517.1 glycosyl transferase, group 1 family protein [Clostridium butyricum]MBA8968350.1 glycosyltransferase involved in cell wall biosynthesis [Clostridium butyricum]MBA8970595.1 glycosyltransferase involved in cell wall biosynthesis [Clostridium butyricum]MBC2426694.1 glycosyltransferase family 4 protein [Clostridium butyricum]MDU1004311.1 glycosyltransferase family 4 protein [Clostridium butyricum]
MNICFITGTIFNLGGVQRVLSVVASELSKQHQITVLCTDSNFKQDNSLYNLSKDVNVEINNNIIKPKSFRQKLICKFVKAMNNINKEILNEKILMASYYPSKSELSRLIKYLNKGDFDYVIGVEGYYSIVVALISKEIRAKVLGWEHNSYFSYFENKNKYYWGQDLLFKKYMPLLDGCIVLTNSDREKYTQILKVNNCITIYNPLSFKSNIKTNFSNKNILFVGRLLEEQKGLDLLIEVFNFVVKQKNEWKLVIVGDGPDYKKLSNLISEKGIEKSVQIFPHTNKISDYYINSSILLSTSRWEGFGLVITEAMECGLPVIAFDNSGPKEIIEDNINGILVKHEDINEMVMKILYLIDNRDIRLKLSKAAIERAKDFNCNVIIEQWNRYFSTI